MIKDVGLRLHSIAKYNFMGKTNNLKNKVFYFIQVLIFIWLFTACGTDQTLDQTFMELKVTKGSPVNVGDYPYFARFKNSGKKSCGGFFPDSRAYFTAAHCYFFTARVDVCYSFQFESLIRSSRRGIIHQQPTLKLRSCKKLDFPARVANKPLRIKLITSTVSKRTGSTVTSSTIIDKVRLSLIDKYYLHVKSDKKLELPGKLVAIEFSYEPLIRNLRVRGHLPSRVYIHPSYQHIRESTSPFDIAVLFFNKPVTNAILPIDIKGVDIGEKVVVMGYGRTEWLNQIQKESINTSKVKRKSKRKKLFLKGDNTVSDVGNFITIEGAASDSGEYDGSVIGKGDSGGPLISNFWVLNPPLQRVPSRN